MNSNRPDPNPIDLGKRKTLHVGAGLAVSAFLPAAVLGAETGSSVDHLDLSIGSDPRIKVHVSKTYDSSLRAVRVDNQTGDTITLRTLASSQMTDNGLKYNLDSIFEDGELVLNPYQLRMFFIAPTSLA